MKIPVRLRVLCQANQGAALVELALVTPILLALVIGAVDLGRAYYVKIEMENAAHAGAEYGSRNPSDTAGITAAATQKQSDTNVAWNPPTVTWGCVCSDGSLYYANCSTIPVCVASATRGSTAVYRVQVTTSAVYRTLVPWPGIPLSFTLTPTTATIRGIYP
jgi:Flp pilus assembly protein TadG